MKQLSYILILLLIIAGGCRNQEKSRINLNGTWKISLDATPGFEKNETNTDNWRDIQVPGECQMQGFAIKHDKPFVYSREFEVPTDFSNRDIILCFGGVYSYARVWVNGTFVRDHTGGFTPWSCDITALVTPGENARIMVECTDKMNEQSYASGYAKHQIGGILRDVSIEALPVSRVTTCHVGTILDTAYRDALLTLNLSLKLVDVTEVTVTLTDPRGRTVKLDEDKISLTAGNKDTLLKYPVRDPLKWDAEHPNLYTLKLLLTQKGTVIQETIQKVGFRTVEIAGNEMLINGMPVKLRGACRHDVHPLLGRVARPEYDLLDARLAKEANLNFIRTSHYPPTKRFADLCDSLGIYLEVENAACFVGTHRLPEYDSVRHYGPEFKESLVSQAREMVGAFRNNPSVIIWSLGNESQYDENFQAEFDYIRSADTSRPVIFSYPGTVSAGKKCYDIISMHYPTYRGFADNFALQVFNFENDTIPVLYDEWAHVACYNKPTIQKDLNIREFWGRGLDSMWINSFAAKGSLGGAIWGMIDETFCMPDTMAGYDEWWGINPKDSPIRYESRSIGYGEWGFIDVWRRKKPEFWSVKKAYSPVRVLVSSIKLFHTGEDIELPVYNRFDHTNLNEILVKWEYEGLSGTISGTSLEPHRIGNQIIPGKDWKNGENLKVSFLDATGNILDVYNIVLGDRTGKKIRPGEIKGNVELDKQDGLSVMGRDFSYQFDPVSGHIKAGVFRGDTLIKGGPFLQYTVSGENLAFTTKKMESLAENWKLQDLSGKIIDGSAVVVVRGTYNHALPVTYRLTINGNGDITTGYSLGKTFPRELFEMGIMYEVDARFDKLAWVRESYWSEYPDEHMGRPKGEELLRNLEEEKYREAPKKDWAYDVCNFYYQGVDNPQYAYRLPHVITALKENVHHYTLINSASGGSLSVISDGSDGCRISQREPDKLCLVVDNLWDYPDLLWGNYMKMIRIPGRYENEVVIKFNADEVLSR